MERVDVDEFRERGFVTERGFFTPAELQPLIDDVRAIGARQTKADYLTDGGLVFVHNLYRNSENFRRFIGQQRIVDYLSPLMGGDIWLRWDQAVTKHPGAGVFHWHQDNAYNRLLKPHYQLWIALTESREQNGGLWLAPGSHKRGLLQHENVGHQVRVITEVGATECIDATIGDVVLFSSLMLHRTGPNTADTSRIAYVAEYMPLADYDLYLPPPYFIVSRGSISQPHFERVPPGIFSLENQLLYRESRVEQLWELAKQPLRMAKRAVESVVARRQ